MPGSGIPTLVQVVTFASGAGSSSSLRKVPLPNAVLSGNIVIVEVTCANGETPTISDDQSNTYTVDQNTDDGAHGQRLLIARKNNCTNAPTEIRLTGTALQFMSGAVKEFYNVDTSASPLDGTPGGATGTDATPKSGSTNTGSDKSLVVSCFVRDDASLAIVSWTSPSGTLTSADVQDAFAAQYQIKTPAGAVQPQITWDSAAYSWIAASVAYKAANAGTAPSATPRVVAVHHQAVNRDSAGSSEVVQCPTGLAAGQDPMLYASFIGVASDALTSITDTASNSWVATGPDLLNGGSGHVRGFYAKAPTLSATLALTLTYGGPGASPGDTLMFYECLGMDQSTPFDAQGTATGTGTGTSFVGASVTPADINGLVFSTAGITSNTVIACSGSTFLSSTDPNEETSPWFNDENNGWAFKNNPNTAAVQVTWTTDAAADQWAAIADAFGPTPKIVLSPQNARNLYVMP